MQTVNEGYFSNRRTLVRVDFNVATDNNGQVIDDFRMIKALPTIKFLADGGAVVILISHLEGEDGPASLRPVARHLETILERPIKFLGNCVGKKIKKELVSAAAGKIFLLENLRFYEGEKQNDLKFARQLAENGDYYVNEAFSVCHRKHASVVSLPRFLPSFMGLRLREEIDNLQKIISDPVRPLAVIVGGVKVETKAKMIAALAGIADHVLVGSKIGVEILSHKQQIAGRDMFKFDPKTAAIDLTSPKIHLPIDGIMALKDFAEGYSRVAGVGTMRREEDIYDIGPETAKIFGEIIKDSKTIFFNGPMGWFEKTAFSAGTKSLIEVISRVHGAWRVAGGGQTLEAIKKYKAEKNFNFLSTGGGAMLEYLSGGILPGIAALSGLPDDKNQNLILMPLPPEKR